MLAHPLLAAKAGLPRSAAQQPSRDESDEHRRLCTQRQGHVAAPRPQHVRPDSEFWSVNRAKHLFADGYELVAFDLPAANG